MSSICISNCINDTRDSRVPVHATYVNLHKWPESEVEFVKSVHRGGHGQPRVVDSISCRQLYLRSYPFTKEETPEKTKCFGRVVKDDENSKKKKKKGCKRKSKLLSKAKDSSCAALLGFFHRLLSCTTSVDVMDVKE